MEWDAAALYSVSPPDRSHHIVIWTYQTLMIYHAPKLPAGDEV